MTTNFLDNKICTFKMLLSSRLEHKFYFDCRLTVSETTPVRGIPENSFWGSHFGDLGAFFLGEMRVAKVDMLGRGDISALPQSERRESRF